LVPIINDATVTIGEAWMPPVVDDIANVVVDLPITASQLLAHKFTRESRCAALADHIGAKRQGDDVKLPFTS